MRSKVFVNLNLTGQIYAGKVLHVAFVCDVVIR